MFLLALAHVATQARARVGVDPRERAGGARGGREHHALQAVGVRARLVHDRRRGLPARRAGRRAARDHLPDPGLAHAAATALIGGIFSLWGAIVAGIFNQLLPFLFQAQWGVNPNFLLIIFGVGLLQVLLTAPGGLVEQFPKDMANLGRLLARGVRALASRGGGRRVIEVKGLTVRFAGVTPIDDMSVVFPGGTCGLIGPNGAGKTTFFNVLSGFVKPAAGSITAFGEDLLKMADYRRARWGLRRTFQTEMAIEQLSVFDNVAMIHEHSGAKRAVAARRRARPRSSSSASTCRRRRRSAASARATGASSRSRARSSASRGSCCSTSRPPGCPTRRPEHLTQVIQKIPEHFGALVILVDHDMSLVSAAARRPRCSTSAS